MKPTSATQHSSVISLLQDGYSVCQIASKTGLGRSTIGCIKQEVGTDKENLKGGCPSVTNSNTHHLKCRGLSCEVASKEFGVHKDGRV